jgi:N-acetylmuramoyl-L-alanine amidase
MICIAGLLAMSPLFAAEKKEVSLRSIHNDNIIRIVLESDENSIKNASIIATPSSIKIEFPDLIEFKKQQDFIFETSSKDRFLSIKLKNVEDVTSYKLSAPSRIVIDLKISKNDSNNINAPTVAKPKQEAVKAAEKPIVSTEAKPRQEAVKAAEIPVAAKVIFLDAGHGGFDYGIISKDTKEKDLNLIFTKELGAALSKKGNKTFLTRKIDQSLSILERITLVNRKRPDLFISMHSSFSNAFVIYTAAFDESETEASARLYSLAAIQSRHIEKSRSLAKAIGKALKDEFKGDVFTRELPLPVLSSINSTAVIIEYPSIQLNAYDQKMRDRLANAVVKGIQSHE